MFYIQSTLLIAALFLASCGPTTRLSSGDLVFVEAGDGDLSDAISQATGRYDHVAIISVDAEGTVTVIEASPAHGVVERSWAEFASANTRHVVMSVEGCDGATAVERARAYIGRPYDWAFAPTDSALYCSELVQLCYLDDTGQPLFIPQPMNFRDADGNMPQYWIDLFDKLQIDIPQGVPGTNPTDISKSKNLKIKDI